MTAARVIWMAETCRQADPSRIARELSAAESYNQSLNYYEMCRRNNRFYHGDQWHGLETKRIQLMTENFLQRPVSYFIAQIVSDDVGFDVDPLIPGMVSDDVLDVLPDVVDRVMVRNDFYSKNRDIIKQAALECEGCMHWFFDANIESQQQARGDIRCELIPSGNVLFGNPYSDDTQDQPYIIIKRRVPVQQMRERAKQLGCAQWERITADSDTQVQVGTEETSDRNRCTEILKYWKQSGTQTQTVEDGARVQQNKTSVHFCRVVGDIVVQPDTETGCSLYPVARMCWNRQTGRYHGSSPISSLIPAQITVNRSLTLICEFVKNHALPKVFYDKGKFPYGISNDPTRAYACNGEPSQAVYQIAPGASVPADVVALMDKIVEMSRDFIGTSDAALGNIRPDNTSAIVAVQKATAAPLLLQTQSFYQYVRECIRIVIDQIGAYYGMRIVRFDDADGANTPVFVDFSAVNVDEMDLNVSVGAASYWSELTAIQTMDNLVGQGVINLQDPELVLIYLRAIPDGYIPDVDKLIKYYEQQVEAADLEQQGAAIADQIAAQQDIADAEAAQAQQAQAEPAAADAAPTQQQEV